MGLTDNPGDAIKSLGPKKAVVNGDVVETHSLADLIAWDKYVRKSAGGPSLLKIRRCKITQPGPGSRFKNPEC